MASRKKQSEGIALLSMYNDEEEDEDMEDAEGGGMEEEEEPREGDDDGDRREPRSLDDALMADSDRVAGGDSGEEECKLRDDGESSAATMTTHARGQLRPPTPQQSQGVVSSDSERSRRGRFGIVDYGHDEVAMSPEPEEGELERSNGAMFGADHETSIGDFHDKTPPGTVQVLIHSNQATPQLSDPSQSDKMNYAVDNSEIENGAEPIEEEKKGVDPLDKFLPPPSKEKCSEDLQRKINKFLEYKKAGKSFNAEVRNRKDYRNPDFLLHAVSYQDIDQIGSCFSKDVFDPHGYDPRDYYDEIEADLRRDMERKEQERKMSQKVEFFSAGTQPAIIPCAAKINLPIPGPPPGLPSGASALPSADTLPRDGRQNKKSKWDKVDGDRRNPLPSGVPDPILTVGSQTTATLSAANVGAGYSAFVQQRRREAEERSRKLERRS